MKFNQSDFYCTCCGKKGLPVQRKKGQEREKGHLKKLYCIFCNKEINHVEIKPDGRYTLEDFQMEYEYGNFDEQQERKYTLNQLKELVINGKIKKEKTLGNGGDSGCGEEHSASQAVL